MITLPLKRRTMKVYGGCVRLRSCLDVDECATKDRAGCSHECVNTQGSYECVCPPGYRVTDDQKTCQGLLLNQSTCLYTGSTSVTYVVRQHAVYWSLTRELRRSVHPVFYIQCFY